MAAVVPLGAQQPAAPVARPVTGVEEPHVDSTPIGFEIPAAVPPSAPVSNDPGQVPTVPIFGPHTAAPVGVPAPSVPGADGSLPPQPETGKVSGGGIREDDIRAYVVPEMDLTPVQTAPGGAIWERNAVLAFHKAKTLQRPLLLLFTARWNGSCEKLSEEVFISNTFNDFAKENCVICFVDYPRNINQATDSMRRVKKKYQVRGYPTMLIFDPDGNVVQQVTGYRPGKPIAYYNNLFSIVDPLCIHLEGRKKQLMKEGYRDWVSGSGTTVFALFVSHNGEKTMVRGPAGDRWVFPISTLSPNDQALVRSFPSFEELQEQAGETPTSEGQPGSSGPGR